MSVINQPRINNLGDAICQALTSEQDYSSCLFYILVAYAKKSGVIRIKDAIELFRERGGRVIATIGLDQKISTIQGLQMIYEISDELYVFHSEALYQTFHPKVYVLEAENEKAQVFIGSSNLTSGGLFTNYEANQDVIFNLSQNEDRAEYENIRSMIESYKNIDSPCCRLVDEELLTQLNERGYLANEEVTNGAIIRRGEIEEGEDRGEQLFGTERFTPPAVRIVTEAEEPGGEEIPIVQPVGVGFWKKLSNNDVSPTSSPGQIIIPMRFLSIFPEFSAWQTTATGARQADVFFNVIFTDFENRRYRIDAVRGIHYIPAPHHPRPNQELRFTFRDQDIFNLLQLDDMLVFRRTNMPDIWFDIKQLREGSEEYIRYSEQGNRFGSLR